VVTSGLGGSCLANEVELRSYPRLAHLITSGPVISRPAQPADGRRIAGGPAIRRVRTDAASALGRWPPLSPTGGEMPFVELELDAKTALALCEVSAVGGVERDFQVLPAGSISRACPRRHARKGHPSCLG
jgi:hypothetical protein